MRFNEDNISKVPALHLLQNLGYEYLTPQEALELRGNNLANVVLDGILDPWLRENNSVEFKEKKYPFTEGNISSAVQALKNVQLDGLIRTNEKIFDLVCLGKSLPQIINGNSISGTLNYIDWKDFENNVFHVTEEFSVEKEGSHDTRRPDIILFVNGIPFCIIECKSPHRKEPMKEAISQQIRNQKLDEIPNLFLYSQLLLGISKNEAKYATTGTPKKFWAVWREKIDEEKLQELVNIPLTEDQIDKLLIEKKWISKEKIEEYGILKRKVTEQDRTLFSICRPSRLLKLIHKFIVFDGGEKKIARYQQYFCVKKIMKRIENRDRNGKRSGGVVWHTQGSGKSLTMVFLAKSIAMREDIPDYKIVLVTDRINLDKQIYDTFYHCGKAPEQARTGKDLSKLLSGKKQRIITTIINKFSIATGSSELRNTNSNIFVLVDEGHRGQYKFQHAKMRRTLPNACYIGFTGTPVMKKDRNTVEKFGGLIDSYTIDKAVEDKAVVPLLYEGRHVSQKVDSESLDGWFERITSELSQSQKADLKKKFATTDQLNKTSQKVMRIAWDISEHFKKNWQGKGFKGQLVAPGKPTALLYKKYLDEFGIVTSEVIISGPDDREGEEDIYKENKLEEQKFWKSMMQKFGTEKKYNDQIIAAFKSSENPEIIIVVDKLITGFDAPRNTILYLTRILKEHTLLQAIARVNRLCDGKDFGYIIDYRGVLENLNYALDLYSALPDFDEGDLASILTDISEETAKLPQRHSDLLDSFKEIKNRNDEEEYELLLADEKFRIKFYERLSKFSKTLSIALSSEKFLEETPIKKINLYRADLKFYSNLRISVGRRYAETIDFSEYESKIQKLLDTHIGTGEIEQITSLVNIFDKEAFTEEVEKLPGVAARADTIAYRTARTIQAKMEEDPAFYLKFSELLKEAIKMFREERIKAKEYLKKVTKIMEAVVNRTGDEIPEKLNEYEVAKAYFGVMKELIKEHDNLLASIAILIDEIVEKNIKVNWTNDTDIKNQILTEIEDCLFEYKDKYDLEFTLKEMDKIMEKCLGIAIVRREL